ITCFLCLMLISAAGILILIIKSHVLYLYMYVSVGNSHIDKSHYVLVEYNGLVQALSNTCSTMSLKVDGIIILAEKPWHEHSGSVKGNGPLS
ncbi:MAG: hypothetical protein ACI35J_06075, partial [Peribacillus sp.]